MFKRKPYKFSALNEKSEQIAFTLNEYEKYLIEKRKKLDQIYIIFNGKFYLSDSIEIIENKKPRVSYKGIPKEIRPKIQLKVKIFQNNTNRIPPPEIVEKWVNQYSN